MTQPLPFYDPRPFPDRTWNEFTERKAIPDGESFRCKVCGIYHYVTRRPQDSEERFLNDLDRCMRRAQCRCRIHGDVRDFSINGCVKRVSGDGPPRGKVFAVDRLESTITIGPVWRPGNENLGEQWKHAKTRPASEYEIDWGDDWVTGPDGELRPPEPFAEGIADAAKLFATARAQIIEENREILKALADK